jgi:hypothetical protein
MLVGRFDGSHSQLLISRWARASRGNSAGSQMTIFSILEMVISLSRISCAPLIPSLV